MHIKICGITDSNTALFCAKQQANSIGLVFWQPSPRLVSLQQAITISDSVGDKIQRIGVFQDNSLEYIEHVTDTLQLDYVQLHQYSISEIKQLPQHYKKIIAVHHQHEATAVQQQRLADYLLLDNPQAGMGKPLQTNIDINTLNTDYFVAGGLHSDNVNNVINRFQPFAVDVSSGVEHIRGIKSPSLIAEFIQTIRGHHDRF